MLQWMGGSRRKVTSSRKSTHKRQKQYFEQRKRQKRELAAGFGNNADEVNTANQHPREQRSLDILSLLNLSTVARESSYPCPSGMGDMDIKASRVNHIMKGLPTSPTGTTASGDSIEITRTRSASGQQMETISPKKISFSTPNNCDYSFSGTDKKPDRAMEVHDQQLSVFDLLCDDGPDGSQEGNPVFEAHVAFSVEGLGKLGKKSPRHSPKQPERIFSYQCSSPWKAARRPNSCKNLSYMLDDLEFEGEAIFQDDNMPRSGSSLEFPIAIDVVASYGHDMQNLYTVRDNARYRSKAQEYFLNTNHNIGHDSEDIWNDRPSFLDDDFVYETEHDIPWNNQSYHVNGNLTDFVKYGNDNVSDHVLEGPYPLTKRDYVKATEEFNILGSPFPRHQTSENYHNLVSLEEQRHYNSGRTFGFEDVTDKSDWSHFAAEDAKDNLSLLSEESCSSSAVRGEAVSTPLNPSARNSGKYTDAFPSPRNKCHINNIFTEGKHGKRRDETDRGKNVQGKYMRRPFSGNSKLANHTFSSLPRN